MNRLTVRPRMYVDESLRGYVTRSSEANYFADPKVLYRVTGIQKINKFANTLAPDEELDLSNLNSLLGQDCLQEKILLYHIAPLYKELPLGIRHHFWRYATCAHRHRFCPCCIRKKSYHKDIWELSLYIICPFHQCLMIDQCDHCRIKIDPYRKRLLYCRCGFDYRNSEVKHRDACSFSAYLHYRFYKDNNGHLQDGENILDSIPLIYFLYLISVISRWFLTLDRNVKIDFNVIGEGLLAESTEIAMNIFCDWPLSFYKFVDNCRYKIKGERKSYMGFSPLTKFFNEQLNYPEFNFIKEELNYNLLHFWKNGYSGNLVYDEKEYKKCEDKIYAYVIREGKSKKGLGRKEVAALLGIGIDQIEHFVLKGIIKPISGPLIDGNAYFLFNKEEITHLLERINHAVDFSELGTNVKELFSLYRMIHIFMKYDLALADIVANILEGKIKPAAIVQDKIGLNRFLFDPIKVRAYLQKGYVYRKRYIRTA